MESPGSQPAPVDDVCAFLGPLQVNALPASPAERIAYGHDSQQFGELRLPQSPGPHPVAVVIHGGCWKARHGDLIADLANTAPLASALADTGLATWNIEYRRTDSPGGGWPGTFQDVADAVDHLRVLARTYPLDLRRVVIVGHSAGGHLGTWAAARHRLPPQSDLHARDPLRVAGVVNLAGPADLEAFLPQVETSCGEQVLRKLLGGLPAEVPERYSHGSPARLLPIGVKQIVINGVHDLVVPLEFGAKYRDVATGHGDDVVLLPLEHAAHFEVIAPGSVAWPVVRDSAHSLLPPANEAASR